jgi:hypothetical protein
MNNHIKVSFDFDGTLAKPRVQSFAKFLVDKGFDVWVVTSRSNVYGWGATAITCKHYDVEAVAQECGIKKIHFTCGEYKAKFLAENNFLVHLDDDKYELDKIGETNVNGIFVNDSFWINQVIKILNRATE